MRISDWSSDVCSSDLRKIPVIAAAALLTAWAGGTASAQSVTDIAWGGSNPGGVMYYMVGVAGTEIGKELPEVNITQVTTGGSTENAKRLIKGEIGRASCRERLCQSVELSLSAVAFKKKIYTTEISNIKMLNTIL